MNATKMGKYVRKPLLWILVAAMSLGAMACRYDPEKRWEHAKEWVSDELELNAEQQVILDELFTQIQAAKQKMKSEREGAHELLIAQINSEQLDEAKILTAFEAHQQQMNEAVASVLPTLARLHSTLTAEQKATLVAFIEKHGERGFHGGRDW
ncbi:Spy/CpxP family protein refolding chaperone [Hahella sp. KA22]|uniref:Spy/CpxP family protein refolding chaperone n=1 Tax=Hahella sp. KA22 TaxID=1628392 RepID=UPI0013E37A83|nr:Spy/CpxP family protein refolding chaperone [Hahella sp. KA22]